MQEKEWQPRLYVLDKDAWQQQVDMERLLCNEPAGVQEFENALVLPLRNFDLPEYPHAHYYEGGVLDKDNNFVAGAARKHTHALANYGLIRGYDVSEREVENCDEEVIFGGMLRNQFGHFIVDSTTRFWYLSQTKTKRKIVFVKNKEDDFKFPDFLELIGIKKEDYEIIEKPKRFKKVIVPEETFFSLTGTYKKEWLYYFDKLRESVEPSPYKKIYLTRTAFSDDMVNERYFEKFYESQGFHVVSPEKHSLAEQIAFMAGADDVACTAGTLSHAAVFTKPNTKIHLLNRVKEPLKAQIAICEARDNQLIAIDAFRNYLPTKHGGCCVLLSPNDNWNAYIKDEFNEEPDLDFIENQLPKRVLEYIEKWGDRFQKRGCYAWIKDFDMSTLVTYVNEAKYGTPFEFKINMKSSKISKVEKKAFKRALTYQEFALADDIWTENGYLNLKGTIGNLPLCDWKNLEVTAKLEGKNVDPDLIIPTTTKVTDDGNLNWVSKIDLEVLKDKFSKLENEKPKEQVANFVIAITSDSGDELDLKVVTAA